MNIKIQSIGFTVKQALETFIQEKTEKLFRFYEKTISCEVVLKIENSETGDNKHCDIRLVIPGNDLLAGSRGKTFEEATMLAIEAMERQIRKTKTKANSLYKRSNEIE